MSDSNDEGKRPPVSSDDDEENTDNANNEEAEEDTDTDGGGRGGGMGSVASAPAVASAPSQVGRHSRGNSGSAGPVASGAAAAALVAAAAKPRPLSQLAHPPPTLSQSTQPGVLVDKAAQYRDYSLDATDGSIEKGEGAQNFPMKLHMILRYESVVFRMCAPQLLSELPARRSASDLTVTKAEQCLFALEILLVLECSYPQTAHTCFPFLVLFRHHPSTLNIVAAIRNSRTLLRGCRTGGRGASCSTGPLRNGSSLCTFATAATQGTRKRTNERRSARTRSA